MKPPERWIGRSPNGPSGDPEARAGALLRRSVVAQPLSASALEKVRSRLAEEAPGSPRLALSFGVALALLLSSGAIVMSATLLHRWAPRRSPPPPAAAPSASRPRAATSRAMVPSPAVNVAVGEPADEVPLRADVGASPAPVSAWPRDRMKNAAERPVTPEVAFLPPAPPSVLAEESALLGAALRSLRERDDAAGALTLLDEHDHRFAATGVLAEEASTTRIEALLRLGRHGQALALLDARAPPPVGRGRALLALRAELRAEADRCADALADFEALLADNAPSDGIGERALYGRAACRARAGRADAARADLEAYLARYPEGRFAAAARAAVAR